MGYTTIPDCPRAGGSVDVEIVLDPSELQRTVTLLQAVLERLKQGNTKLGYQLANGKLPAWGSRVEEQRQQQQQQQPPPSANGHVMPPTSHISALDPVVDPHLLAPRRPVATAAPAVSGAAPAPMPPPPPAATVRPPVAQAPPKPQLVPPQPPRATWPADGVQPPQPAAARPAARMEPPRPPAQQRRAGVQQPPPPPPPARQQQARQTPAQPWQRVEQVPAPRPPQPQPRPQGSPAAGPAPTAFGSRFDVGESPPVSAAAATYRSPPYRICYTTDPADHNRDIVQAMAYVKSFEGLPGGDGHAGWLISCSRRILNLWECSAGGGSKGQPSLQIMHAQETDFLTTKLAVEPALQLLFAASVDQSKPGNAVCTSVHSLSPESGFLAYKYQFAATDKPAGPNASLLQQVTSLHPVGSTALRNCCASSRGGEVLVWEALPSNLQRTYTRPKASFMAHEANITAMCRSPFAPALLTGAQDGQVYMWDLRQRPTQPTLRMLHHQQSVTAIQQVNENVVVTCSLDTKVALWDLRNTSAPLHSLTPDASPAYKLAVSPFADCLAVSTQRGLHSVDLVGLSCTLSSIHPGQMTRPYMDLQWNQATGELYACGHGGTITVYAPVL